VANELLTPNIVTATNIVASIPFGIIIIAPNGIVQDCNEAAQDILDAKLLNKPWSQIVAMINKPGSEYGLYLKLQNGKIIDVKSSKLAHGSGVLITIHDVTHSKILEDRLNKQSRLMELGKMVATLAHQIKTPLSSAIIYAQHLTNQELPKNKLKKFSLKVNERLLYLQHLLESMLIFVKGDFPIAKPVCIFKFLDDLKTMIASLKLQYCFECIILNEVENAKINIDDNSIICAFSNLIINSIESSNAEASILIHVYKENNIIKFCISDKGLGIEEKLQAKIFEPFFTTKVTGTGLGLAVVKQIITNYAGKISCQSSNKNGTKMLVEFEEIVNA